MASMGLYCKVTFALCLFVGLLSAEANYNFDHGNFNNQNYNKRDQSNNNNNRNNFNHNNRQQSFQDYNGGNMGRGEFVGQDVYQPMNTHGHAPWNSQNNINRKPNPQELGRNWNSESNDHYLNFNRDQYGGLAFNDEGQMYGRNMIGNINKDRAYLPEMNSQKFVSLSNYPVVGFAYILVLPENPGAFLNNYPDNSAPYHENRAGNNNAGYNNQGGYRTVGQDLRLDNQRSAEYNNLYALTELNQRGGEPTNFNDRSASLGFQTKGILSPIAGPKISNSMSAELRNRNQKALFHLVTELNYRQVLSQSGDGVRLDWIKTKEPVPLEQLWYEDDNGYIYNALSNKALYNAGVGQDMKMITPDSGSRSSWRFKDGRLYNGVNVNDFFFKEVLIVDAFRGNRITTQKIYDKFDDRKMSPNRLWRKIHRSDSSSERLAI